MSRNRSTRRAAKAAKKRLQKEESSDESMEEPSSDDQAGDEFSWKNKGFKVNSTAKRCGHYVHDGFTMQGEYFEDGYVSVKRGRKYRIGEIITMYEDLKDEIPKIELKCYLKKGEVRKGKRKHKFRSKELVLDGGETVRYPIDSLVERVYVYNSKKEMEKSTTDKKRSYFCTHEYYDGVFTPLNGEEEEETTRRKSKRSKKAKKLPVKDIYHHAFTQLQLCVVPDKLPCRDKEHREIYDFIRGSIQKGGTGSGLYISGMPGTGKTATLRQIKRELRDLQEKGKLNAFKFVEINAMKLPTPNHAFTEIYRALTGNTASPRTANLKLEKLLTEPRSDKTVTVIMLDELDYLLTRNENVIYTLFEWPSRRHARIVCLGIANTMDLIEQLTPRVQSRLGLKRIKFAPYKREDIDIIVRERIRKLGQVFDMDAIAFCAAKVASVSGDVRRALQICRRATKICEAEVLKMKPLPKKPKLVGLAEINLACKSLFSSSDMRFLSNLALYPKFFITSLAQYVCANKTDLAPVEEVYRRMNSFMNSRNHPTISFFECEEIVEQLAAQRMIVKMYKIPSRVFDIRLNVQIEDVAHALQGDQDVSAILNTLNF